MDDDHWQQIQNMLGAKKYGFLYSLTILFKKSNFRVHFLWGVTMRKMRFFSIYHKNTDLGANYDILHFNTTGSILGSGYLFCVFIKVEGSIFQNKFEFYS